MILIVEDDQEKAAGLRSAVAAAAVDASRVLITPTIQEAKERLRQGVDVLLLDLQIPDRYGDRPSDRGGARLVQWMFRHLSRQIPQHIVAVTSFGVATDVGALLNRRGIPVVHFSPSSDAWSEFVTGLISRAYGTREAPMVADAVVVSAVTVEATHIRRTFNMPPLTRRDLGVNWSVGEAYGLKVAHAQASQMGLSASSTLVSKAIHLWRPKLVVAVGICAGVRGSVEVGDIIVPSPCWNYGSGKLTDEILKPDPRPIPIREPLRAILEAGADVSILQELHEAWPGRKPRHSPRVFVQPGVSGSAVVADSSTIDAVLSQSRKVVGLDMEAYGVYYACENSGQDPGPGFCSVKSVVDFADPEKGDDHQDYAAAMSAGFAKWLIGQYFQQ